MASEVGVGYVRLIPTAKGFGSAASKEIGGPLTQASERAGKQAGKKGAGRFAKGFQSALTFGALFGGAQFLADGFAQSVERADLPGQMERQFGLTGPAAAAAGEAAGDVFADGFGASVGAVAVTVGSLQRALDALGTGESVERLTRQAEALAVTFGQDVNETITAASQLVRNGLAPDMETAFDVMTRGFQSSANQGQDLLDTITEYSGQFSQLGLDAPTSLGLVNQALAAGARNSDFVADAFKELAISAVDGSATTAAGFEAIGLSSDTMAASFAAGGDRAAEALQLTLDGLRAIEDPVLRDQAAVALFKTKAEDLGDSLYALDPATAAATGGMAEVDGAAQSTADGMENSLGQQVTSVSRELKTGLGSALVAVAPLLLGLLNFLEPLLPILTPVAIAIGVLTAAQWAWNVALAANPIGLLVVLIGGLVAAIVWIATETTWFQDIWNTVWGTIKSVAKSVADWWTGSFWPGVKSVFQAIGDWAVSTKDKVVGGFEALVSFVKELPSKISSAASGMWDGIKNAFKNAVNWLIGKWNNLSFTIPSIDTPLGTIGGFTLSTPNIPMLAKGAVAMGPTLAVVGEGTEPEAIMPLSRLDAMLASASGAVAPRDTGPESFMATAVIDLGEGVQRVVDIKLQRHDRDLKRRALAGTGAAR